MNKIKLKNYMEQMHGEMIAWRQHIHQFPETAFQEQKTADFIQRKLESFGLTVEAGIAETGLVASLTAGQGDKKMALRADIDALFIQEKNKFSYRSQHDGIMHACGHDGHTTMLLGAAKYLAKHPNFNGTVYFIFQPAEEGRAGAKRMIDEGLFEKFPAESVFGLHNFPQIPASHFAVKSGAMMAAFDCFEIRLLGQACHAAMPHLGQDVIVTAASIINTLQTVVSREVDPNHAAVLSFTQLHAGNTWNAIPENLILRGTFRCFDRSVSALIRQTIERIVQAQAASFGIEAELLFNPENPGYPVTSNSEEETRLAIKAAEDVVGKERMILDPVPSMGSEDFAYMLQEKPGCYIWLGNGMSSGDCLLHNPHYDFNDEILPIGVQYWVRLVELGLP